MLNELATTIRVRRLSLGLSERQFCAKLGIEEPTLRSVEQGTVDLDIQTLYAIASELEWPPATLVSKAESLLLANQSVKRHIEHSIRTRRQLDQLEQQHLRMKQQLESLKKQIETMNSCKDLFYQLKASMPRSRDAATLTEKLESQKEIFNATMGRLIQIRKACDEHEMFMQRRRAHKLRLVR
jgi:transcriptional regulator with XRE-family HTH domain